MKHKVTYSLPGFNSMSAEEIRKEQERLLAIQLRYDYDKSPLYKKKFDDAGARPEDIRTLDDLRRLPIFMTKVEERASQQESLEKFGHPFGMHLCAPVEDLYVVGTTSGTTGSATFSYIFTKEDVDVEAPAFGHDFTVIGVKRGDRVLWCYALGIYATTIHTFGIRHMGALPIDIDARAGVEMMLTFAEQTKPVCLATTPSLAMHLAERAPSIIHKDVRELGFKALQLTGEPWAAIPEIKSKIEEQYGCRAYDYWAPFGLAMGMSCDSDDYYGMHAYAPHLCTTYQDLVDPITKEPIEITDGGVGEMVFTALQRKAGPVLKYANGDMVKIFTKECPGCGFKGIRVKLVGRSDDMLIVKGVNIYPTAIKEVVASFMPKVTEMRIILDVPPPRVVPPLKLKVEYGPEVREPDLDGLAKEIGDSLHNKLKIRPAIEWVRPGTLERSTRKTSLFEKRYETKGK